MKKFTLIFISLWLIIFAVKAQDYSPLQNNDSIHYVVRTLDKRYLGVIKQNNINEISLQKENKQTIHINWADIRVIKIKNKKNIPLNSFVYFLFKNSESFVGTIHTKNEKYYALIDNKNIQHLIEISQISQSVVLNSVFLKTLNSPPSGYFSRFIMNLGMQANYIDTISPLHVTKLDTLFKATYIFTLKNSKTVKGRIISQDNSSFLVLDDNGNMNRINYALIKNIEGLNKISKTKPNKPYVVVDNKHNTQIVSRHTTNNVVEKEHLFKKNNYNYFKLDKKYYIQNKEKINEYKEYLSFSGKYIYTNKKRNPLNIVKQNDYLDIYINPKKHKKEILNTDNSYYLHRMAICPTYINVSLPGYYMNSYNIGIGAKFFSFDGARIFMPYENYSASYFNASLYIPLNDFIHLSYQMSMFQSGNNFMTMLKLIFTDYSPANLNWYEQEPGDAIINPNLKYDISLFFETYELTIGNINRNISIFTDVNSSTRSSTRKEISDLGIAGRYSLLKHFNIQSEALYMPQRNELNVFYGLNYYNKFLNLGVYSSTMQNSVKFKLNLNLVTLFSFNRIGKIVNIDI